MFSEWVLQNCRFAKISDWNIEGIATGIVKTVREDAAREADAVRTLTNENDDEEPYDIYDNAAEYYLDEARHSIYSRNPRDVAGVMELVDEKVREMLEQDIGKTFPIPQAQFSQDEINQAIKGFQGI